MVLSVRATTPNGKFFPVREVAMSLFKTLTGRNFQNGKSAVSLKSDWKLNMDFGILNLIVMDAKLDFNVFRRIFLIFTVSNSRFSKNNTKCREVKNEKALSEREVKSKRQSSQLDHFYTNKKIA